jgi:hypothetical protein
MGKPKSPVEFILGRIGGRNLNSSRRVYKDNVNILFINVRSINDKLNTNYLHQSNTYNENYWHIPSNPYNENH